MCVKTKIREGTEVSFSVSGEVLAVIADKEDNSRKYGARYQIEHILVTIDGEDFIGTITAREDELNGIVRFRPYGQLSSVSP
jgi:hypothetical protein